MKTQKYLWATLLTILSLCVFASNFSFAQTTRTDNLITHYQQLLRRNPRNAKAYYGLGDALIRKARETGDPGYFNRAEEALKKTLDLVPQSAGAMRHLAYVFYSRHEFASAAAEARRSIEIDGTDGDAYGILGDALLEVGKYDQAKAVYAKMMQLEDGLYARSRLAGLKSFRGDSAGAIADLEAAIAAGKEAKQPAESIAWAEWQLGSDYFAIGNLAKAEAYFQQSLQTYPKYYRALAGLAQVRGAQKNYGEAIELYQKAIAILPMPDYAAALGDIYSKMGRAKEAKQQYDLVEYIGRLSELNQVLYNRELAYFYADHDMKPQDGLALAQRELAYRRDIYAYDVVAWNLFKNGKLEDARAAIENALHLGTKDAKLFYHAGMIYYSLGAPAKAEKFLTRVIRTNPDFHPLFSEAAARTLEQLKRVDQAGAESQHHGG
jgi:tetratricopeptide (TPR) repeat protein